MTTWKGASGTEYEPVIGLEVHAQLRTASKLFCACPTVFGAEPNHHCCPVCTGMPGTLPVINRRAVELAIRLSKAVGGTVHSGSVFSRKNYFYPDLPKGYQISQFDKPLCTGGGVWIETEETGRKYIRLTRIHMEDDAGKSSHGGDGHSLVDLNRSGMPLCEVVSEADMRSAQEAMAYMKAMRSILRYTEVSDGNMEEGSFRCDANVSVRVMGTEPFGTKSELKNINSFRFVGQAIEHEIRRHIDVIESGGALEQDTRLWDSKKQVTVFMRSKEDAHDYRYFPEPDLLPLELDPAWVEKIAGTVPELADERSQRFQTDFELPSYDAGVLTAERELADYYEKAAALVAGPDQWKTISNWIMGDVRRRLNEEGLETNAIPVRPQRLVELVRLIDDGVISGKIAKKVFDELWERDVDPASIVEERGWRQVSDTSAIDEVIQGVLADNPNEVEEYRGGKTKLRGFFVGQVMRAMRGQGNPQVVNQRLSALLDGSD